MNPVERYINRVLASVLATAEERARFEADLRAHFADAEASGQTAAHAIEAMGRAEDVAAAFNAERSIEYAGFWRRLVAFVGDMGVLGLAIVPFVALAVFLSAPFQPHGDLPVLAVIVFLLAFITYENTGA